jgi:phosphatidylglycerophosphate synthase
VIKAKFGAGLDVWIRRCFPFLFGRALSPNALTVTGTLVSLAAAAAFASGSFIAAGLLVLAGGFFDLVDGVVARDQGRATRFGAFLDSTLDRVQDMVLLLGLTLYYARAGAPHLVLLAGYVLAATLLTSYLQARAELVLPAFRVGMLERAERVLILAAGALSGLVVPALWLLAVGCSVTVAQRFARAWQELAKLDAADSGLIKEKRG